MKKIKIKKLFKQLIIFGTIPFILSGCSKKSDCEINCNHIHQYTNSQNITTFIDSEEVSLEGFNWQDISYDINNDDKQFFKAKDHTNNTLLSSNEPLFIGFYNWDYLYNIMKRNNFDFLEYYYEYETRHYVSETDDEGNDIGGHWEKHTETGWSRDPYNSNNTGKVRLNHHRFFGYRIINKKGKYKREKSPLVDDIRYIIEKYPYFKTNCVEIVNVEFSFLKRDLPYLDPMDFNFYEGPNLNNKDLPESVQKLLWKK